MHRLGDRVRLRRDSEFAPLLAEAAALTGTVGNLWTDDRGERISVNYPEARVFVPDLPAGAFELAVEADTAH